MATITGGKYAVASLSAVNTRTLAVTTTPFVSGDFLVQRIVGLWNSAGTTFKGMAYVRRFLTTSTLELNAPFFDPATGNEVAQVVGDTVLVSKNFTESVAAGLAVSGGAVTLTDSLILGTASQSQSLCFYDEAKVINSSVGGSILAIQAAGGLAVLGQLQSYADRRTGKSCSIFFNGASSYGVVMTNAAAVWCMFGGSIEGTGGSWNGGYGGTSPNLQLWMNVVNGREFISPGAGGNWTNPARQMLINCSVIAGGIAVRWGNGSILGGAFRMPAFAASPFALFGSDTAGTYSIGAPSGTRLTANLDGKPSGTTGVPALWRSSLVVAQTLTFTNVLSYDRRAISGSGANHTAATQNFYFSDTYTNLVPETVGVVLNGSGIAASTASVSGSWSPSLLHETWSGVAKTATYGPWTFGLKAYGYRAASGAFSTSQVQLEGTLTADNVAFGGVVNQTLLEPPVTLSKTAALALSAIVTLDHLYDAAMAWSVSSVANAQYPTLGSYPIGANGKSLNLGALNLVIDANAASAFAVNTAANTVTIKSSVLAVGANFKTLATTGNVTFLNGATTNVIYSSASGNSGSVELTNLTAGSSVLITDGAGAVVEYIASSGTSYTRGINAGATGTWTWRVAMYGYQAASGTFNPASGGLFGGAVTLIPDTFVLDTKANVAAYTDLNTTQKIYDYISLYSTSIDGIALGVIASKGFGTLTVTGGLTLDPSASAMVVVSGGVVTVKSSGLAEDVTILSAGEVAYGIATLSNEVKIRASNLDSELVFVGGSLTLYPNSGSRDTNTSAGTSSNTGIIRFKNGATVLGVTMGGAAYARVDTGVVLFKDFTLLAGYNLLDIGTSGLLASISAKVVAIKSDTALIPGLF